MGSTTVCLTLIFIMCPAHGRAFRGFREQSFYFCDFDRFCRYKSWEAFVGQERMTNRGQCLKRRTLVLLPAFVIGMRSCSAFSAIGTRMMLPRKLVVQSLHADTARLLFKNGHTTTSVLNSRRTYSSGQKPRSPYSFGFGSKEAALGLGAAGLGTWIAWPGTI
jgi:hypothetical protein